MRQAFLSLMIATPVFFTLSAQAAQSKEKSKTLSSQDRARMEKTLKVMEGVVRGTIPYEIRGKDAGPGEFTVDNCRVPVPEILKVLLSGSSYTQKYKFEEDCDIEGTVIYSRDPFKVDLKTRNTGEVDRIVGIVDYKISPELRAGAIHLNPLFKSGQVFVGGKVLAEFTADYKVTTDFLGKIKENKGGTVDITKFNGQPFSYSHQFKTQFVTK